MRARTGSMKFCLVALSAVMPLASGCATATKSDRQGMDVFVKLPEGAPRAGVVCVLANRTGTVTGNAPMLNVEVERSGSDMVIDCRTQNGLSGRAIAVSRIKTTGVTALLGGVTGTVIDHLTGKLYDYPRRVEVAIGRERVFAQDAGLAPVSDVPLAGAAFAQAGARSTAE